VNRKPREQIDSLKILKSKNEKGLYASDSTCQKNDKFSPVCNARLPVQKNSLLVEFCFFRHSKHSLDATTMDRLK